MSFLVDSYVYAGGGGTLDESIICGGYNGVLLSSWETYNQASGVFTNEASSMSYANDLQGGGGTKISAKMAGGEYPSGCTNNAQTNASGTWTTDGYNLPFTMCYCCGGGAPADFLQIGGSGHGGAMSYQCWEDSGSSWTSGPNLNYEAYGKGYGGNKQTGIVAGGNGIYPYPLGFKDTTETYNGSAWATSASVLQSARFIFGLDGNIDGAIYINGYSGAGYGAGMTCGNWTGGAGGSWTNISVMPTVAPANTTASGNTVMGNDVEAVGGTGKGASYAYIPYMFEWDNVAWTRVGDLNVTAREYGAGGFSN